MLRAARPCGYNGPVRHDNAARGLQMIRTVLLAGVLASVASIASSTAIEPGAAEGTLNTSWMDKNVDPMRDFYMYVNGNFIRENPIPAAYSSWGQAQILNEHNQDFIHDLLQAAAADTSAAPGSETRKIGDFYASGMDEAAVEKAGIAPLKDEFARIAALRRPADLSAELAHLQIIGVDAVFSLTEMQDFADSTKVIGTVVQGGLGL